MQRNSLHTWPGTLLCCLLGALLGTGAYTFREGEGLAYLGSASKPCANCHIMRDPYDGWQKASHHAAATCNDCHMPYVREGAVKISDHQVRSPLLNPSRSCQTCHRYAEKEILARTEAVQDRTKALMLRAEQVTVRLVQELANAKKSGAADDALQAAQSMHRQAQWRLDFVAAENSMEFHAPQESARILVKAIDLAHCGRLELLKPGAPK